MDHGNEAEIGGRSEILINIMLYVIDFHRMYHKKNINEDLI